MRRIVFICGLIAAFLCLGQNANAQYVAQIHRSGDSFTDQLGRPLQDDELIALIGPDIYRETVVGARKQFNAGRKLIIGGASALGAGLIVATTGLITISTSVDSSYGHTQSGEYEVDESKMAVGYVLFGLGSAALVAGDLALGAGITFKVIGQSRLNWVENDFNARSREVSARFGPAPHGFGLTLDF